MVTCAQSDASRAGKTQVFDAEMYDTKHFVGPDPFHNSIEEVTENGTPLSSRFTQGAAADSKMVSTTKPTGEESCVGGPKTVLDTLNPYFEAKVIGYKSHGNENDTKQNDQTHLNKQTRSNYNLFEDQNNVFTTNGTVHPLTSVPVTSVPSTILSPMLPADGISSGFQYQVPRKVPSSYQPKRSIIQITLSEDVLLRTRDLSVRLGMTELRIYLFAWYLALRVYTSLEEVTFGLLNIVEVRTESFTGNFVNPQKDMEVQEMQIESGLPEVNEQDYDRGASIGIDDLDSPKGLKSRSRCCVMRASETSLVLDIVKNFAPLEVLLPQDEISLPFNTAVSITKVVDHVGLTSLATVKNGESRAKLVDRPCQEDADHQTTDLFSLMQYKIILRMAISPSREHMPQPSLHYDTAYISPASAENISGTLGTILQSLSWALDSTQIRDIETLSPRDTVQIYRFNCATPVSCPVLIHTLIRQQATLTPLAPALHAWDGQLTYAALDTHSARLAQYLKVQGMKTTDMVPYCFEKSVCAVIVQLAILKLGAAAVPLDAGHPRPRLESIVRAVEARAVVCSPEKTQLCSELVPVAVPVTLALIESLVEEIAGDEIDAVLMPQSTAFVMFSSGSTGTPKGILQSHLAISTVGLTQGEAYNVHSYSRVYQWASYNFDVATMDTFLTLIRGGCVCIPSERDRMTNIVESFKALEANYVSLTPTVVGVLDPEDMPGLETLLLAGEAISQETVTKWAGRTILINCYGPVETTACTSYVFTKETASNVIGPQLPGCRCWVVSINNKEKLASIGEVGILVVEGPTLAKCYLKDPVRTANSFLETPKWFPQENYRKPWRFYDTGDLVYYSDGGVLNYVGRRDTQIKVRGQRVDTSEIEFLLAKSSIISKAVVAYPQKGAYQKRLTAVVELSTLTKDASGDILKIVPNPVGFQSEELSHLIREKLPDYMVPTDWIVVHGIPLNRNAKIDRVQIAQWLDDLATRRAVVEDSESIFDRTADKLSNNEPTAQQLNHIAIDVIGSTDNQFRNSLRGNDFSLAEAGLDSIQAITLSRRISKKFEVNIEVARLFAPDTTIRNLAGFIDKARLHGNDTKEDAPVHLISQMTSFQDQLRKLSWREKGTNLTERVMVTGATGSLGLQIIKQLLTFSKSTQIIAHVRAPTYEAGVNRIVKSAKDSNWWANEYFTRVEVWLGDLAKPRIGLPDSEWARLTGEAPEISLVHAIIHCGAAVKWNASFNELKHQNVQSTVDLLAATAKSRSLRKFVYISGGEERDIDAENQMIGDIEMTIPYSGYGQSKLVSECLIKDFATNVLDGNCHFSVIKPGYIIGTAEHGIANPNDYFWKLISTTVDSGLSVDEPKRAWIYVSGADRVANAVTDTLYNAYKDSSYSYSKVLDGVFLQDFWNLMALRFDYHLRAVSLESWRKIVHQKILSDGEEHCLWPLLNIFEQDEHFVNSPAPTSQIVSDETQNKVKATLIKNVEYLQNYGLFQRSLGVDSKVPNNSSS